MNRSGENNFTSLIQMKYPTPKQELLPKKILSYKNFRRKQALTPITNIDKSKFSEASSKPMTDEEFLSMLEIKEKISLTEPSEIGQSLFDLSLDLRSLTDVLNQIKFFKHNAPLNLYRYMSLLDLINAAVKCPPDATLLLLTIGGKMIKLENYARPDYLNKLIKITQNLIISKHVYSSYDNQKVPREKLRKLLELFKNSLNMPKKKPEGAYGTSQIERLIEEKQKEQQKQKLQNATKSCVQPKRKRIGITPIKTPENFLHRNIENNNDNTPYDFTGIRKQSKADSHTIKTPKTGTPRKSTPSSKSHNIDFTSRVNKLSFDSPNGKDDEYIVQKENSLAQHKLDDTKNNDESEANELDSKDDINEAISLDSAKSIDECADDNVFLSSSSQQNEDDQTKKRSNHLKKLHDELDIPSSTLASSSFLNILDNALDEFDFSESAANLSGINTISKELHEILFDNESEKLCNENSFQRTKFNQYFNTQNGAEQTNLDEQGSDDLSDATFCSSTSNSPKKSIKTKHNSFRQNCPEPLDLTSIPITTYETTIDDDSPFTTKEIIQDQHHLRPNISASISQSFLSKDEVYERIQKGNEKYSHLDQKQIEQISEIAKLFNNWPTAYKSSKYVWKVMNQDLSFDLDTLLSQIPVSFGEFLLAALKSYYSEMQ